MNDFTVLTLPDSVIDQIPAPGSGRDPDRFQIMIRFAPGLVESADASIDGFGGRYEKTVTPPGLLNGAASDGVIKVFSFPTSAPKDVLLDALSNRPGVEAVEIDHVVSSDLASSDLLYQVGITWGLYGPSGDGIGSYSNYFGSAADVAWANAQASADGHIGSMKTVIGVIDTGIDPTHPDLYLNIWVNQNEIPTGLASDQDGDGIITFRDLNVKSGGSYVNAVSDINSNGYIDADDILSDSAWADGIDDDSNGYTDDLFGWDFYNNDNRPFESFEDNPNKIIDREPSDSYHGTHVAGTIGAVANTDGVVGVAWEVQLMPLRFLGPAGTGDTSDAISAIYYYRDQGLAHPGLNFVATNNSWGGGDFSQLLADAIEDSGDHGHLFVAAAGNDATDNDVTPHYPSNLNLTSTYMGVSFDPVISVAAIDSDGNLSSFSNWGATSVDIGAPGSDIASTFSGTEYFGSYSYVYLGGTSMATPHVTGAIALIASENPGAMPWDIRDAILERAVPLPSLDGITTTGARLNVANVIDLSAPSVTVTLDAAILTIANPTTTVTFAFSEEVQNFGYDDITITNGAGDLTGLTSSDNITFTATFQAATLNGTTATIIVGTGYQDLDSEIGLGGTSDPFAVDLVAPTATITAIDASTGTSGVDISGTVSAAPAIGEFVFVLRDGTPIAVANVSGTNWNYTDTETLADGLYAYTALVADLVGNGGLESDVAQYYSGAFDFDLTVGTPETGDYGRAFNGTADADGKITTRFTSTGADLLLSVTGFDIDFVNEVQVLLNGSPLGFLAITGDLATGPTKLPIDAADQIAGENVIQFVNVNPTYAWGITDVLVAPPPSWDFELVPGTTVTTKYGNQFDGKTDPDGVITAGFTGTSGDLILTLDGFDVDFANEVTVALNGTPLGNLAVTANNATGPSEFMIPVEDQLVGENLITFTQNLNPTYAWGITNLLIEAAPWWDLLLETGTTDTMSYGKAFNGTNDADGLITARFDSIGSDLHLSVTTYDVDFTDEVQVKVNGTSLGFFGLTANNGTGTFGVDIPAGLQVEGENAITFQNKNAAYVWGLTDVLLETDPAFTLTPGSTETGSYGNKFNGQTDADGVITATFIGTAGDLELTLQGFDVDFTDEVRVDLNGQPLGFLALTANNMEGPSSFAIPVADQLAGENVLTFVQTRDVNYIWGLTDVALNPIA